MSNLLEKASILLTPTGYDNGSMNCIKPNTSVGDFDFTRGTAATRVNSQGLIENVQILSGELVQNGDFATDSDWVVTDGWSIENGKANIDTSEGTGNFDQLGVLTVGKKYRLSLSAAMTVGRVKFQSDAAGVFIFSSDVSNHEFIASSTSVSFRRFDTTTSGYIDNVSVIEITDDTDLPRIDYTDGTGSLLLEPQSTNLLPYSEDFSQWNANGDTVIESGYLAPDGSNTAYKVTGSTANLNYTSISNTTQTRTIWARTVSGTGQAHLCSWYGNTNNLFTITEQWQRFEVNGTTSSTGATSFYAVDFRGSTDLTEVIIWGAQLEDLSYATSYIPTSGTIVPRNQDIAINSGDSNLISQTEGVLYCEIAALFSGDGDNRCITLSDGIGNSNTVEIFYQATANTIKYRIKDGNSVNFTNTETVADRSQFNKIAFKYKSGDNSMWLNGVKVDANTSTFSFTTTLSELNFSQANGSQKFFGKIKSLAVFKEALTDAELTCLTS